MTQAVLHELQVIDSRIGKHQEELEGLPEKEAFTAKSRALNKIGKQFSDATHFLNEEKLVQSRIESEIEALEQKISREEERLYGGRIGNPKELKGIEDEVGALKRQRDQIESRLLEKLESIDKVAVEQHDLSEKTQKARADADLARAEYERAGGEIEAKIAELNVCREQLLEAISPENLKLYDQLRADKQGLAVAELIGAVCSGCRMELPSQELERIIAQEPTWRCPHCRRILVRG